MTQLRVALALGLALVASAFQAPASAVARSTQQLPRARFSPVAMVADEVKGIIAEQLGVELDSVTPGASFTEDLGADSLDAVELIMAIERPSTSRSQTRRRRR